jgi:adenylyltransferase/sulfurtransferase
MGTEGQLTVYNYQPTATATANAGSDNVTPTSSAENNNDNGGGRGISCSTKQQQQRTACYRCLYPKSTTTDGCKSCSDNGVLGMVPGVIGILQAVEVIKILTDIGHVMHDQLVMYDSLHGTFINVKKPPPRINCAICSIAATITTMEESEQSLLSVRGPSGSTTLIPSTTTCPLGDSGEGGGTANVQSISCIEYNNNVRNIGQPHILLDVRVPRQYEMCSLDGSINLPLEELESQLDTMVGGLSHGQLPIYCLCRRGIASTDATRIIQKSINDGNAAIHSVYNITGGLQSWVETVDSDFPEY